MPLKNEDEDQFALLKHIENLLGRLGEQDLRYEERQRAAKAETGTPHDAFQEERARVELERLVHQMIELARGIALRDRANEDERPPPDQMN